MPHRPLSLFGLHGTRDLAERVAGRLDVTLAPHKARPLQDVRGHDTFVLHALHGDDRASANDKLCRLLFFCGAGATGRAGNGAVATEPGHVRLRC